MHRNHSLPRGNFVSLEAAQTSQIILFLLLIPHCTIRGLGWFLCIAILGQSVNGENPSEPFQGYLSGQKRVMPNMVSAKSTILICLALVLFISEWPKARSLFKEVTCCCTAVKSLINEKCACPESSTLLTVHDLLVFLRGLLC